MRIYKDLLIRNIKVDRHPINLRTLLLLEDIKKNGLFKPIKVQCLGNGSYKIKDGRHRITAHKLLGKTNIKCCYGLIANN